MSSIVSIIQGQVMGTREIAELIEKQHSHIKVSAERLADRGVIGTLASREFTHNGNIYTEYLLNKRDSLILVAQNCPEYTARIVDRWQGLEAEKAAGGFKIPQTLSEALRLAADLSDQVATQQIELKRAAPKVELVDNFLRAGEGKTGEVVAKELAKEFDIGRNRMYAFLKACGVFNDSGIPRQIHIDAGRFYLQPSTYETTKGHHQSTSVRFTAKGEFYVRALLQKEGYAKRNAA